jgi:S-adenosylmethionine-dependent methyltransferase
MTVESNLVESWYDARAELEEHRLDEGRLEFEVTMRTIESLLSEPGLGQAKVLDIGGGPGKYGMFTNQLVSFRCCG